MSFRPGTRQTGSRSLKNAAFFKHVKILFTGERASEEIVKFFPGEMELPPHFCKEIRIIIPDTMAQERMDTGDLSIPDQIEDLVMRFFYPEPLFE